MPTGQGAELHPTPPPGTWPSAGTGPSDDWAVTRPTATARPRDCLYRNADHTPHPQALGLEDLGMRAATSPREPHTEKGGHVTPVPGPAPAAPVWPLAGRPGLPEGPRAAAGMPDSSRNPPTQEPPAEVLGLAVPVLPAGAQRAGTGGRGEDAVRVGRGLPRQPPPRVSDPCPGGGGLGQTLSGSGGQRSRFCLSDDGPVKAGLQRAGLTVHAVGEARAPPSCADRRGRLGRRHRGPSSDPARGAECPQQLWTDRKGWTPLAGGLRSEGLGGPWAPSLWAGPAAGPLAAAAAGRC